jgi:hypothetical protein
VSLQMLHQAGMLGEGLEDKGTTEFIPVMAKCQPDVVSFVSKPSRSLITESPKETRCCCLLMQPAISLPSAKAKDLIS